MTDFDREWFGMPTGYEVGSYEEPSIGCPDPGCDRIFVDDEPGCMSVARILDLIRAHEREVHGR